MLWGVSVYVSLVWEYMYVKTCRKKKKEKPQPPLFPRCYPPWSFLWLWQGLPHLTLHNQSRLADQQAPETSLSLPPQGWTCKHAPARPAFYSFAGGRAQVLQLYPFSHLLSPKNDFPEQLVTGKHWEITELWWNNLIWNFKITFFEDVKPVENPQHKTFLLFPTSKMEPSARQVV